MYQKALVCLLLLFFGRMSSQDGLSSEELHRMLRNSPADSTRLAVYNELCWPVYSYSKPDSSLFYGFKAIALANSLNDKMGLCIAHRRIGITYSNVGNLKEAVSHQQLSFNFAEKLKFKRGQYLALNNIGVAYLNNGLLNKALFYFLRSLSALEGTDEFGDISRLYMNCGMIYRRSEDTTRSKEYMLRARHFAELSRDTSLLIISNCNLSATTRQMRHLDSSSYYLNLAKNLLRTKDDNYIKYNVLLCEGLLLNSFKKYNEALKTFEECRKYVSGLSDEITLLINIGEQYDVLKQSTKALSTYARAFELSRENGFYDDLKVISEAMAKIYEKQNDLRNYTKYIKLFITYKDSNDRVNRANELIGQQLEFDYQRKHVADSVKFEQREHLKNMELQVAASKLHDEKIFRVALVAIIGIILLFVIFISSRLVITRRQKRIIERQKLLVEIKNKEISDSINYAKRLQEAILPQLEDLQQNLDLDVLYLPKDIIGGDFYFFEKHNSLLYFAVCDCTGHGVPGAIMSVVCHNALTKAIKEFNLIDAGLILSKTRDLVIEDLNAAQQNMKDGMDCSLLVWDPAKRKGSWAGANNPLWIFDDGEMKEIKADKQPVAYYEHPKDFTTHNLSLKPGSTMYLFTDGYADQFGGLKAKKFKSKALREFLTALSAQSVKQQVQLLHKNFIDWKGQLDQVDDVAVAILKI